MRRQRFTTQDRVARRARGWGYLGGCGLALLLAWSGLLLGAGPVAAGEKKVSFEMLGSAGVATCLPDARATVKIKPKGPVQEMHVEVWGLPPKTAFTLFVLQLPTAPFGLAWYQGDIDTNHEGKGHGKFIGIFSIETFIVAPGSGAAPVVHPADASTNPATAPVHTYHLGMWFDSAADAAAAGCASTVTPFNGDHTAGIQVLNTRNFPNDAGPLRQVDE